MSRYDHKIETSLEGIEHLSREKKEEKETNFISDGISILRWKTKEREWERIWKTTTPKEKTYKKKTNEKMKEM